MESMAVIFDMDGVLVDSWELHYISWKKTGAVYGFDITREAFGNHFGQTCESFVADLSNQQNITLTEDEKDKWLEAKDVKYRYELKHNFPEHPEVSKFIKDLNDYGFKTGVGSSAPKDNIEQLIDIMDNGELLAQYASADCVQNGKPDPEVFLIAAERLGVKPQNCAVFEDSLHGLEAAKRAGMVAFGVTGTAEKEELEIYADHVIESMGDITPEEVAEMITISNK